jgi:Papain-like cysteine protease AvrRpt2
MEVVLDRRHFIGTSVATVLAAFSTKALAAIRCGPFVPPGVATCEVGIDSSIAQAFTQDQKRSNWCWAACIEMIFRYYGYSVSQDQIVLETWGTIDNLPGNPQQILADLNRQWIDGGGYRFGVAGDVSSSNPGTAAQDLSQNMPLIIGTMGHAMVLTGLAYRRDHFGNGTVIAAVVRDPWPGMGKRVLSQKEWDNTNFLVRVRVFPI